MAVMGACHRAPLDQWSTVAWQPADREEGGGGEREREREKSESSIRLEMREMEQSGEKEGREVGEINSKEHCGWMTRIKT